MDLWALKGDNSVTMAFKVKSTDETKLEKLATITTKDAVDTANNELNALVATKGKQDLEKERRDAQHKLYETAKETAKNDKEAYDLANTKAT